MFLDIEEPMAAASASASPRRPTGRGHKKAARWPGRRRHRPRRDFNAVAEVVHAESVRVGGDRFDEAIVTYVRRNYGSLIGESTAERIKQEIGTAFPGGDVREVDVRGRNFRAEGVPRSSP